MKNVVIFLYKKDRMIIKKFRFIVLFSIAVVDTNFVGAINIVSPLTAVITLCATIQQVDGVKPYRVRNADTERTLSLYYKCSSKSSSSRTIKPGSHAKLPCAPSSMSACVLTGDHVTDANSIFCSSPTDHSLKKYRTFKVTVEDCPSKHHQCGRNHHDRATIFSRDFGTKASGNSTVAVDYYDISEQSTDYVDVSLQDARNESSHSLRGYVTK